MNSFFNDKSPRLKNITVLLDKLSQNIDAFDLFDQKSKNNFCIKMQCLSNNIDILEYSIIDILSDIKNKNSILSNDEIKMIRDGDNVTHIIDELLPYLLYYYFNRKNSNVLEGL